jgi:hypothetical protein
VVSAAPPPVPASRAAGRVAGRWWRRWGPALRRATGPARTSWATAAAYGWFAGYVWIGLLLSAGAAQLTSGSAVASSVVGLGGATAFGAWQARHRLRRHRQPATPPLRRFGPALAAWLVLLGLVTWLQAVA